MKKAAGMEEGWKRQQVWRRDEKGWGEKEGRNKQHGWSGDEKAVMLEEG